MTITGVLPVVAFGVVWERDDTVKANSTIEEKKNNLKTFIDLGASRVEYIIFSMHKSPPTITWICQV